MPGYKLAPVGYCILFVLKLAKSAGYFTKPAIATFGKADRHIHREFTIHCSNALSWTGITQSTGLPKRSYLRHPENALTLHIKACLPTHP
jgi:hypothetical protein